MTKTTDSRQVRLLVGGILSKHGIDSLQLEMDLTSAVQRYYKETKGGRDKVTTRERILSSMEISAQKANQLESLLERIKTQLGIDASGNRFDLLREFLLREEEHGKTVELFREWWDSQSKYERPSLWKIADRPSLLLELWASAFPKENAVRPGESDGEYPTL